ncbi:hypothetical protein LB467_09890 [Salegentibacter sp. JZCK2]|uniref:hypothetical protein n=1 Tax=Salegentibacter tibetensis TaxID=2873600 RepID=UPI001CCD14C6|nr:hypothetical protein [Salegentibacter tibetensis]MBZ9729996.1 hypothetical protein [Salegentibacter tibetensis]
MFKKLKIKRLENQIKTSFKEYTVLIVSDAKSLGYSENSPIFGMLIKKGLLDYKVKLKGNLAGIANSAGLSNFEFEILMDKIFNEHLNSIFS